MSENPDVLIDKIGMRVLRRRQELGLKQSEVAARLGITAPNIVRIENGRQNVTVRMLCRLAEALETTVHELMFGVPLPK